jgi:MFS family permease
MSSNGSLLRSGLALFAGIAADIIGSLICVVAVDILLIVFLMLQGVPGQELQQRLESLSVRVITSFVGFAFTMIGAYVAARIARRSELFHGALNAGLATAVGWTFLPMNPDPIWLRIVLSLLTIPIGVFGGWIALAERRRSERWHEERLRTYSEDEAKYQAEETARIEAARSGYRAADLDREL